MKKGSDAYFPVDNIESHWSWNTKPKGGMFLGFQIGFPREKIERVGTWEYQWKRTTFHFGFLCFSFTIIFNDNKKATPVVRLLNANSNERATQPFGMSEFKRNLNYHG